MDGNGRWAAQHNLPRNKGHEAAAESVTDILEVCVTEAEIKILTLFAFSSENWKRPESEVSKLMQLFLHFLHKETATLHKHHIRFTTIGDIEKLPQDLQELIKEVTTSTAQDKQPPSLILQIAVNYGGKWDITQAIKKITKKLQNKELTQEDINEETISNHLSTHPLADVDLLIRTSGEQRISNFMLWQTAYAEIYFTNTLFPDFNKTEFQKSLEWFQNRKRRYGNI
ncbi:MAG: di-trans,poly-cis-decaprenylcistransferase [Thiotrichales bacterium]|nr:MAG: di-trans,poly-cis-decaprenylcistransferase [Thiotrichales bacterium]